ncbi:MAG TPA: ribonuclease D [Gemmatimonadales bacterium]|nr:ribonuclease D [Gemmatimonadales bacterium]
MTDYRYVETAAALAEVLAAARAEPLVAADTEAASFHRYKDRVYLVQLSTRRATSVIDPLPITDFSPFGSLLADANVEKVFHDADYDLRTLDRDYGFRARHLFDTRISAQLAGEPAIGLAALLEKYLGVRLTKAHQRADWSQRPLTPAMLAYAADDTRHLPRLRDALRERLTALGRLGWAEEEFRHLEDLRWTGPLDNGQAYQRIKGAKALPPRSLAALRELVAWREGVAAERDTALFRVIGNEALLGVSRALPRSVGDLATIKDLPASLARRHGAVLVAAVGRALALAERDLPTRERAPRAPHDPELEGRVERLKVARNTVAQQLGLDPGVLCGKSTLEAIARQRPVDLAALGRIEDVRKWQVDVLGAALLAAL